MKGIIFKVFNNLVEKKFGIETWDELLDETNPASGGAYTSAGTYADNELFAMVGVLSRKTKLAVPDLIRVFGNFTLHQLALVHPQFFEDHNLKTFLLSIHNVIHVEVKKLYEHSLLPVITYEDPGPDQLVLIYNSPRKLCSLAEGLITGAAEHFHEKVEITQTKCMHRNDNDCRLELKFSK